MLLLRQQRRRKLHGRGSKDFFSVFWKDSQCERFSIIGCCQFHLGVQTTEERKEELLHEAFQVPPPVSSHHHLQKKRLKFFSRTSSRSGPSSVFISPCKQSMSVGSPGDFFNQQIQFVVVKIPNDCQLFLLLLALN